MKYISRPEIWGQVLYCACVVVRFYEFKGRRKPVSGLESIQKKGLSQFRVPWFYVRKKGLMEWSAPLPKRLQMSQDRMSCSDIIQNKKRSEPRVSITKQKPVRKAKLSFQELTWAKWVSSCIVSMPEVMRFSKRNSTMCEGMAKALFYEQKKADSKVGL